MHELDAETKCQLLSRMIEMQGMVASKAGLEQSTDDSIWMLSNPLETW